MKTIIHLIINYKRNPMASIRHHAILFALAATALLLMRFYFDIPLPLFWPLGTWFMVMSVHFFVVRSMTVTDEEADAWADDLRRGAYDSIHIRNIYNDPTPFKSSNTKSAQKEKRDES